MAREIVFKSQKVICEIAREKSVLRLQYGQWNDNEPSYDLRTWYTDRDGKEKCGKGLTLSANELATLVSKLSK